MTNPYAPPHADVASHSVTRGNRLLYIWIWLPTAIFGAMLATPADFLSILLAMAFALPCFLVGVAWGSELSEKSRWTLIIVCSILSGLLAAVTWYSMGPDFIVIAILFTIVNVALGYKSGGSVLHNRFRIFGALVVSFTIGLLLGPIGIIILTVPSVLIANHNAQPESGDQSDGYPAVDRPL